jgi:hypothetical protein
MIKNLSNTTLLKGVLIAVLFHVIVGLALVVNKGRNENQIEPSNPEAVSAYKKVTYTATFPKPQDNQQIRKGFGKSYIYSWLGADGVKHYSNSAPPSDARNVEFRKESKSGLMADHAPIVEKIPAYSVATGSAAHFQLESTNMGTV